MSKTNTRHSRQSFLGPDSESVIHRAVVGIVGLGGGGSHIVQQLAHIGFERYVIYDPDFVEESNLNRLVGAMTQDAKDHMPKIEIASRVIRGLQPHAEIAVCRTRWQMNPAPLRGCDLVFGCVDGFSERRELEVCARRYLIPLIDIGMDVHQAKGEPPRMAGQVILSMPGYPCMTCLGFLNERTLAQEAAHYGAAGPRPQVVWPNAVLASTAVGIAVDLLTDWTTSLRDAVYFSYDGNSATVRPHPRLVFVTRACLHFRAGDVGDPLPEAL